MSTRFQMIMIGLVAFLLGTLAAQNLPYAHAQQEPKGPKWLHGLGLKVRAGNEDNFTDKTKKVGIEVFRDENNGNLIYVSETGSIAVVPSK